jgi:hypothetical protein
VDAGGSGASARTSKATGQPFETLSVDAGKLTVTYGTGELEKVQNCTLVVSGTFSSVDSASGYGYQYDALYCYA